MRRDARAVRRIVRRIRHETRRWPHPERCAANRPERRAYRRTRVQWPVHVTPASLHADSLRIPVDAVGSIIGYTIDVSLRGVGLIHDEPILTQHAIVTFDLWEGGPLSLLIEIMWSRYREDYAYRSGGKFLAVTRTP